ncbi:hypothetical protein FMUBM48_14380 [Nocardia cyriacigeorgica]|nr:hypothetical protein FMUBM48_14380 [Nocardia cyriacigeorgica]
MIGEIQNVPGCDRSVSLVVVRRALGIYRVVPGWEPRGLSFGALFRSALALVLWEEVGETKRAALVMADRPPRAPGQVSCRADPLCSFSAMDLRRDVFQRV